MEQPQTQAALEQGSLDSWEPRFCHFDEDGGSGTLGQHNLDDHTTRTKIMHMEFLGLGVVGSVCSVTYGKWHHTSAALLVMQFDFRARDGTLRYKKAEVSISFVPQTASAATGLSQSYPVVRDFRPKNNKAQTLGHFTWPADEFSIRGRTWPSKDSQETNEVAWTLNETTGSKSSICEPVKLAVIVTFQGPFKAVVEATATTGLGLKLRNFPWSRDDPLLFDGVTHKGKPLQDSEFNNFSDAAIVEYISLASPSSESLSKVIRGPSSVPNDVAHPTSSEVKNDSKSRAVFRVRGIPASCRRVDLVKGLTTSLRVQTNSLRVHSFTSNPYREGIEMMAVLSFDALPEVLRKKNAKNEWLISVFFPPEESSSEMVANMPTQLLVDTHFLGFSRLGTNSTVSAEIKVDIIAIHGLGGHAYGSFKERGGTYMWLEDSLPAGLRTEGTARILIYGYDAHVENSDSFQSIEDLASQLRLLILLNHHESDLTDLSNLKATVGALFLGVPNRGMDNSALLFIIGSPPNREFLQSLSIGSPVLEKQRLIFPMISSLKDSLVFSFYETCVSGTAKMEGGRLTLNGPPAILVDKDSATHSRPWDKSPRFLVPIKRSHSELGKFERYSDDYEIVLRCILELVKTADSVVGRRFENLGF
ncbi:hypothetical protein CONLIGDRAFT_699412 [Coniochaeta ligniaria NRRL 30616]|uniref:Uncharacterized protein n=1 Tax=Coniochaeta ligniaria NRRL 30616 TaxID=1408157 RepID=A0A1J7IYJ7_9PEZI|nr:hypothetical protein CONLIGDRAFT_699412 [Coniochaeta ligniaria NRRL 30616]